MVVLRDSYFSRCGYLAIVEETEPGVVDGICIPDPRRNCIDQEAISGRTHKARIVLVLESMECTEGPDHSKCDYVHSHWYVDRLFVEMVRNTRCGWTECRN